MIMGTEVAIPWPISDWPTMIVTLPSVPMRTNGVRENCFGDSVAAMARRLGEGR
jgi:hypothetical protein